ncbi:MAG: hypothetical protein ACYTF9_01370 [Planctomycetota bacterium]
MRIDLRDERRRRVGRTTVDPAQRPTRVVLDAGEEVFLRWDTAMDDAGHLRRCVVCGAPDLYVEKAFPQVTGFVVVLAFTGAVVSALGYATAPPVLAAMVGILVLDLAIFLFSGRRLVCYRCRSSYHDLEIARYHKSWDRSQADKYSAERASGEGEEAGVTT